LFSKHNNKKKSILIIRLRVMILQALPYVNLTLFNTLSDKINFPLESSHRRHKMSKRNFNVKEGGTACDDDAAAVGRTGGG
jgi:hypothetical protein